MHILKDPDQNNYLWNNGFIILDCLEESEVFLLKKLYLKWHKDNKPKAFYKSYFSNNINYKEEVEQEITRIIQPKISNYFLPSEPYGGMFVVKPKGKNGHLPPHQDWSFVSEKIHWSLNMWCPLDDVNEQNGNMQMLPGSHRFMQTIRGFNTKDQYSRQKEMLNNLMVNVPMKKGEIIFFFHGIIHGSTKNLNEQDRVSIGLSLKQKNATTYFHYYNEVTKDVYVYQTQLDFYKNFTGGKIKSSDQSKYIGKTAFDFASITDNEIKNKAKMALDGFGFKRF